MQKYDILYELTKSEDGKKYDLYFYDNTLNIWYFIRDYKKTDTIKKVNNDINAVWNKTWKRNNVIYNIKLQLNI